MDFLIDWESKDLMNAEKLSARSKDELVNFIRQTTGGSWKTLRRRPKQILIDKIIDFAAAERKLCPTCGKYADSIFCHSMKGTN